MRLWLRDDERRPDPVPVKTDDRRAVLVGLMEWYRKAELSCDRAGTLSVQDPEIGMRAMLKFAGGGEAADTNLAEFIQQAEEYRQGGDLADQIFKVLNLLGADHPFPVLRVGALRDWVETGAYDRILRGEYTHRTEESQPLSDDLAEAGRAYRESARQTLGSAADAARAAGAHRIYLESNSALTPALTLYRSAGFVDLPPAPTPYARCNVWMELRFQPGGRGEAQSRRTISP